ncbi:restriction endonuclease subunit S [Paracoccus sp. DMF-8]|uniref:restriction endonuclease subunit S n=1 Tax=Paracoccus sp. DMF-8 TaxID=3019445 RepID=UPI0023E8B37E|nr:restriction endonuclease subunit S [Paracoccus sp. DMF-8]MDF3605762.1 restriction endonuclease subunit S [Paracoccus sp. DMF-8]
MAALPTHGRDVRIVNERPFTGSGARFQNGDTLIARITPCLENGKGAQVKDLPEGSAGFGSTEFIVVRGKDERDDDFIYYLSRHEGFRAEAIKRMEGTSGRQRVSWQQIASIEVPDLLPENRREIAAILGALDDKIEVNRKASATLEEMARALYRSWFVDFDPVWARLEGRQPAHMDAATAALFPDSFGDDGLPVGWCAGKLSDVAVNPRNGVKPEQIHPDTPYIGLEHMPRRSITLPDWGTAADVGSQKSGMTAGDFLFGKLRPYFHKVGIAPVNGICSTDIIVVRPKAPEWAGFVLSMISTDEFVEHTNAGSSGTRMPRTSWSDMGSYEVTLPSPKIAAAFEQITRPWRERIVSSVHESRTLATLRDTLLPRLMSGELRVGEARELVEEVA